MEKFDVAIIGAGISGACIARELSTYNLKVALLEKENDVACGCSKANSGIVHGGYDPEPDTLMAKLNLRGAALYPQLSKDLNFDYKNIGSIVTASDEDGEKVLETLLQRGKENGVEKLEIIGREKLLELEPNIADCVTKALLVPTGAITSPYEATWAIAENAVMNGVQFYRNAMVYSITKNESGSFVLSTGAGEFESAYVVNAAGLGADKISEMAGARKFRIIQRRGEYCLLDSNCGDMVHHTLFQTPTKMGKGVLITPTVDGNILVGPSADDLEGKDLYSTETTAEVQAKIVKQALFTVNSIPMGNIINSFSGIREIAETYDEKGNPVVKHDFLIEEDEKVRGLITVAGISSPGRSAGPAVGEYVTDLLFKAGLKAEKKNDFIATRKGIPSFKKASSEEKEKLIKENPLYGQIICRCEMITEGEIVASIHSPLGALDLDGIKRRTRAGMGRCQSGFCSPRVTEILSREAGIPMTSVTKKGKASYVLMGKSREF